MTYKQFKQLKEKRILGVKVFASKEAVRDEILKDKTEGTICGYSRYESCLRIVKKGRKSSETYHYSFWDLLN